MSNSRPLAYDRVNLFGPIAVNLLVAGDADLLVLNDEDTKFIPTSIVLETAYARGTTATDPVVVADIGTTGTDLTSSLTITDSLDNQGTSNTLALLANAPVVTGSRSVRLHKTTVGAGQATATRSRTSGVATIVTGAVHGFTTGDTITIASMTDATFDDVQAQVTVTSTTAFTYENAGVDVVSGADTAGRVGALYVNAYVVGIYY
jgi:predicted ribonuclease toxin of YeeF-YezG toxin-antitoxin module